MSSALPRRENALQMLLRHSSLLNTGVFSANALNNGRNRGRGFARGDAPNPPRLRRLLREGCYLNH